MWSALLLLSCQPSGDVPRLRVALDPLERGRRVSMAVRGIPLSELEIDRLQADPEALPALVDGWLASEPFYAAMRDLHQEVYWTRSDTDFEYPARGPLTGVPTEAINRSVGEGPLALIEEVIRSDLPYSDVLSVDWTMTDPVLALVYGLAHDPKGALWQRATWPDGRPAAGVLSDNGMWLRHRSSDTNYQRERANAISRIFLCQDFGDADLPVLADGGAFVLGATGPLEDPACAGCHAQIDPVGSFLWGFRRYILPMEIRTAYESACAGEAAQNCYPLQLWDAARQEDWVALEMPQPALDGAVGSDLADLGRMIADHPAFPTCTARNFAAWLTESTPDELPADRLAAWTAAFEDSDLSAKALVRAIVLDESFATILAGDDSWTPGLQHTRPEQWARSVETLTGFRFLGTPAEDGWGEVDLLRSDRYGFRLLMGGISGYQVTEPTYGPTPTRTLALERAAFEAAGTVVASDLSLPAGERILLGENADHSDEASVRAELVHLHRVVLGMDLATNDPEIDAARDLWFESFAAASHADAWMTVVAGLLLHPAMVSY